MTPEAEASAHPPMTESHDRLGERCVACRAGTYQLDKEDGRVVCTNCGSRESRYRSWRLVAIRHHGGGGHASGGGRQANGSRNSEGVV